MGRLESIATFEGGTAVTSRIDYAYNGFGQLSEELLDLDGDGTLAAKRVTYGYGNGTDYSPLTSVDYPYVGQTPARTINYVYGATSNYFAGRGPTSSAFSQIAEIRDGSTPLVSYAYTGMNRPVARWHDGSGTSTTYEYDGLGRVTQLRHATFASLPTDSGGTDLAGSTYGYDGAGNRLFDQPLVMPAHGQAYQYDGLNRLTKAARGVLDAANHQVVAPYASPRTVDPKYDLLGNFLEDKVNSHVEARTHNLANEITLRSVSADHGGVAAPGPAVYLDEPFTGTGWLGHWDPAGNFAEGNDVATSGSPASDSGVPWSPAAKDLMLVAGLTKLTNVTLSAKIAFPEGGDRYGGLVFGYQDVDNYWICVLQCAAGGGDTVAVYQVVGGTWSAMTGPTAVSGVEPGSGNAVTLGVLVQGRYVAVSLEGVQVDSASDVGVPPGRLGVLASHAGVSFDDVRVRRIDWPAPAAPTWSVLSGEFDFSGLGGAGISPQASDPLPLSVRETTYDGNYDIEAWLDGDEAGLALRVKDKLHYTFVTQSFAVPGTYWVYVWQVRDGQLQMPAAWGFVPMADTTTSKHVHVKAADGDVGVWLEDGGTWKCVVDPATNGQGALAWPDAGAVGLVAGWLGATDCYLVGVGHDADNSHTLSIVTEAWVNETFATSVSPTYDDAGNMTSDGIYNYTYDAWNRLVQVTRLGPTSAPQVIAEYAYDGLGRRYRKTVTHSGDRDREAEYFYYDGQWRLLEVCVPDATQESKDRTTRQFVWGTQYIDELVCMDVDTDGDGLCTDENEVGYGFERYRYFQDANWNVTAIWAEHAGHLVERYEYDPYGTCRIFAGWYSAAGCETGNVLSESRVPGGNPIRYAGYHFDNETDLYQVRHRMYSPRLGRWLQRDPLEYVDGMNAYQYVGSRPPILTDPTGLLIDSFGDALNHYLNGGGAPQTYGPYMIGLIRGSVGFRLAVDEMMQSLFAQVKATLRRCGESGNGVVDYAGYIQWFSNWIEGMPNSYSPTLALTINNYELKGVGTYTYTTKRVKCNGQCPCRYDISANVKWTITDTFTARTGLKNLLFWWIPGTPFKVSGTWTDQHRKTFYDPPLRGLCLILAM